MNFADLTDTSYIFQCSFSEDACEYWSYDFSVECWDDRYIRNMSRSEINQLRENCKRILQVTDKLQGCN